VYLLEKIVGGDRAIIMSFIKLIKENSRNVNKVIDYLYNHSNQNNRHEGDGVIDDTYQNYIRLTNGSPPKFLYRIVDPLEYEEALQTGFLIPSQFYKRIHASVKPASQYGSRGFKVLRIEYSDSDGWHPKQGDVVYAVTYKKIPMRKIKVIRTI